MRKTTIARERPDIIQSWWEAYIGDYQYISPEFRDTESIQNVIFNCFTPFHKRTVEQLIDSAFFNPFEADRTFC